MSSRPGGERGAADFTGWPAERGCAWCPMDSAEMKETCPVDVYRAGMEEKWQI